MRKCIFMLLTCISTPAMAGDLVMTVVDKGGKPVPNAVVTVYPSAGLPGGAISFPWASTMVQQDIAFNPHVLIVPVGATVRFPNKDKVRHHIYSFSKPARFEIKLFGKDETRSYRFTTAGAVALGCNIHDMMSGFIKVVDTPFAAKSDASGALRISGLPAGSARVVVWQPMMRAKYNEITLNLNFGRTGATQQRVPIEMRGGA